MAFKVIYKEGGKKKAKKYDSYIEAEMFFHKAKDPQYILDHANIVIHSAFDNEEGTFWIGDYYCD